MKPSAIILKLIKAIAIPMVGMLILSKVNVCSYMSFIPKGFQYEAGLALYLTIIEFLIGLIELIYDQRKTTIQCIFYDKEHGENTSKKLVTTMNDYNERVANVSCHIIAEGNRQLLKECDITMGIPEWFTIQPDESGVIKQEDRKIKWDIESLLPPDNSVKVARLASIVKLSFISNSRNVNEIDLEPTVRKKFGLDFITNGITVQNEGYSEGGMSSRNEVNNTTNVLEE